MHTRLLQQGGMVVFAALAYLSLFNLNQSLFSAFDFSTGVSWVYLPSGMRLMLVLLFGLWGAAGIAAASVYITASTGYLPTDLTTAVIAGLISGLAPWLAWKLCRDWLKLDTELHTLTAKNLAIVALVFATVSPTLHQIWFVWRGLSEDWITGTLVMGLGDWVGTVLMLAAGHQLLRGWRWLAIQRHSN
jgi:hypothetical protein